MSGEVALPISSRERPDRSEHAGQRERQQRINHLAGDIREEAHQDPE
jgi:hypothetical protein